MESYLFTVPKKEQADKGQFLVPEWRRVWTQIFYWKVEQMN